MASWTKAITDPLKAASDLAQGMLDLRDLTKLGSVVVKLNAEILAAQRGALTAQQNEADMAEEIRALKAEVAAFNDWETEKKRYELKEIKGFWKATVYALKEGVEPVETPHYICPDCYQGRQKRILQECHHGSAQGLTCNHCGWVTGLQGQPPPPQRRR